MAAHGERERTTFLEASQVVERTNRYARRARDLLMIRMQQDAPSDERTRLTLDLIERQRAELEAAMTRATEALSPRLLATRVQYSVDPWDREPEPPRSTSIEEAIRSMLGLDAKLITTYREIAERTDNDQAVRALFASLAELVEGFDRRIAREGQNAHDV